MTEPPESRHPEEGDGDQPPKYDPDEIGADEFFDTDWDQLARDDELIDLLHAGDVTINDEAVPEEQHAADVLGSERDRVDREPLPDSTHPDAVIAEVERRKKAAEPPAPRTPNQEGSTEAMTLQESIGILNNVAQSTAVSGALNSVNQTLTTSVLPAAQQAIEQLVELKNQALGAVAGNDNAAREIEGAGEHAGTAIEEVIDAINAALETFGTAQEHEAVFRQTCGNVAGRLAGG